MADAMIVMPANATGWLWHCLARETGRIGHLYSPGAQRGPWPWFPFSLDNGAFSCWDMTTNSFDDEKWDAFESRWHELLRWAAPTGMAKWAIVPDVPGDWPRTVQRWASHAKYVRSSKIPTAIAVQDGAECDISRIKTLCPDVVCVGGTTDWKWATVETWVRHFPRVHVLRCNSPAKLDYLESLGVESCDGTGWNRGDRTQTQGLEQWARRKATPTIDPLTPYASRKKGAQMELFAI